MLVLRRFFPIVVWAACRLAFAQEAKVSDAELIRRAAQFLERNAEELRSGKDPAGPGQSRRECADSAVRFLRAVAPEAFQKSGDAKTAEPRASDGLATSMYGSWLDGFATIALAEEGARGADIGKAVRRIVRRFADRQNNEGGVGHGAMNVGGFYPSTLMAATNFLLLAAGTAKRHGIDEPSTMVADAVALLEATQTASGAIPYGGVSYRVGPETARTAGAVFALAALGRADTDAFRRARAFVLGNIEKIPDGHASPSMHVLIGACAAYVLGDDAWRDYDQKVLARVRAAAEKDGFFDDIVDDSPDDMELMDSRPGLRRYVTACYAAALAAPQSRFLATLRAEVAKSATNRSASIAVTVPDFGPLREKTASIELPCVLVTTASNGDDLVTLGNDGVLRRHATIDGAVRAECRVFAAERPVVDGELLSVRDGWAVLCAADRVKRDVGGGRTTPTAAESRATISLVDRKSFTVSWTIPTPVGFHGWAADATDLFLVTMAGAIHKRSLADGTPSRDVGAARGTVGASIALDRERTILAVEERMIAESLDGHVLWEIKTRPRERGLVPPLWSGVVLQNGTVYGIRTDGRLRAIAAADGAPLWETDLPLPAAGASRSATGMIAVDAPREGVWISGTDGTLVFATKDGPEIVKHYGGGKDSLVASRLSRSGPNFWLTVPGAERLLAIDPADGSAVASIPLPLRSRSAVSGNRAFIASGKTLTLY